MNVLRVLLDLIYPPYCLCCQEKCSTHFLCPVCWELSAPPDPAERCRACFNDLDSDSPVCTSCKRQPLLSVPRACVFDSAAPVLMFKKREPLGIAGFAVYQWLNLDWPLPDAVIPLPDALSVSLGKAFAGMLDLPFVRALQRAGSRFHLHEKKLKESETLLLFDATRSVDAIRQATAALSEAFPKNLHVLSLAP